MVVALINVLPGDHRSMSGRGSHTRGRKRSRSKSPEKQEPMHGEGKSDSFSKKASRSKRHVSPSKSSSPGSSTSSHTRRLKKKRRLSALSDDDSDQPSWAKNKFRSLFQCQQLNEERLERMASEMRRANALNEKQRLISSKSVYKFYKQVYEDQVFFNQSVVAHLRKTLDSNDAFQKEFEINEGINLIIKRNKQLMLCDSYGWTTAQAYELGPIADNSEDE